MFYVVSIKGSLDEIPNAAYVADDGEELVFRNDEGHLVARCYRREVLVYGTSDSIKDFRAYMKPVSDPVIVRMVRKASSAFTALSRRWRGGDNMALRKALAGMRRIGRQVGRQGSLRMPPVWLLQTLRPSSSWWRRWSSWLSRRTR